MHTPNPVRRDYSLYHEVGNEAGDEETAEECGRKGKGHHEDALDHHDEAKSGGGPVEDDGVSGVWYG